MKKSVDPHFINHNGQQVWRVCIPESLQPAFNGKSRRFFIKRAEAQSFADQLNDGRKSYAFRLMSLSEDEQAKVWFALEQFGGVENMQAAAFAFKQQSASMAKPLAIAISEYIAVKRPNVSERHLAQMERILQRLESHWPGCNVADILIPLRDEKGLEKSKVLHFLQNNGWGNTSQRMAYVHVQGLFSWCVKSGYCSKNPCDVVQRPEADEPPREILSIDQIVALLRAAARLDKEMVSYIAIGIFAGIRPDTLRDLRPGMRIDDHFQIPASIDKNGKGHSVDIVPHLASWLALFPMPAQGWSNAEKRRSQLAAAARINPWPHDAMRHSFCSYESQIVPLPDGSKVGMGLARVAQNADHSEAVCKEHYDARVPRSEVIRYHSAELSPAEVLKGL